MSEMMKYYDNLQVQTPEFWQTNRHNFFSVIRNYERNHIKNSTLESYRVLSFQEYRAKRIPYFRHLYVLNEDILKPNASYGPFQVKNINLMIFVLRGILNHTNSRNFSFQVPERHFQLLTSGANLTIQDTNGSWEKDLHWIYIVTNTRFPNMVPRYQLGFLPLSEVNFGRCNLIISCDGRHSTGHIHADLDVYFVSLNATNRPLAEFKTCQDITNIDTCPMDRSAYYLQGARYAWLYVITGEVQVNELKVLTTGDSAAFFVQYTDLLLTFENLSSTKKAELLLINTA